MLKKTVDRYQHGSVRKVKRAHGFAWEFRYYVMEGSKRKPKVQTFESAIYETDKDLRQHLESFVVKLNEKTEYVRSRTSRCGRMDAMSPFDCGRLGFRESDVTNFTQAQGPQCPIRRTESGIAVWSRSGGVAQNCLVKLDSNCFQCCSFLASVAMDTTMREVVHFLCCRSVADLSAEAGHSGEQKQKVQRSKWRRSRKEVRRSQLCREAHSVRRRHRAPAPSGSCR
jgi:hypothetical protein